MKYFCHLTLVFACFFLKLIAVSSDSGTEMLIAECLPPNLELIPDSLGEVPEIESALNIANRANLTREELDRLEKQEMFIEDRKGEISFAQNQANYELILVLLRQKFGEIPPEFKTKMEDFSVEQFKLLAAEVLSFNTLEDVENWLDSQVQ